MTEHTFSDTGSAYDACQCRDDIKSGDILIIREEGVIGIAGTWPFAITMAHGNLHQPINEAGLLKLCEEHGADLNRAIKIAQEEGFELLTDEAIASRDRDERLHGLQLMEKIGGGFASALATAWLRADMANRERLEAGFRHLFDRYTRMARREAKEALEELRAQVATLEASEV